MRINVPDTTEQSTSILWIESIASRVGMVKFYLSSKHVQTNRRVAMLSPHYGEIFPERFKKDQLSKLEDSGVISVDQIVEQDDPIILATSPRVVSSALGQLGGERLQHPDRVSRGRHAQNAK